MLEALVDTLLGFVALLTAAATTEGIMHAGLARGVLRWDVMTAALIFAVAMSLLQSFLGMYRGHRLSLFARLVRLSIALGLGTYLTYLVLKAFDFDGYPAVLVGYAALYLLLSLLTVRVIYHFAETTLGSPRVLIVGNAAEAAVVAEDLNKSARAHRHVVGFYPTASTLPAQTANVPSMKLLDTAIPLEEIVRKYKVQEIIVAVREQRGGVMPMDELLLCRARGVSVLSMAGFYERTHSEVPLESLKASWLVYGSGFVQGHARRALKRTFDLVTSAVLLVLLSPVMLIAALLIKLESHGPVLYRQERVGLGGETFMCLKLRSMRSDAEHDGVARWAAKNDSRVTRVGKFIRKTRIDELPQLISVLRGEMSMVGPRPERPAFVTELKKQVPFYDLRHTVKPGVTGWAQVRYAYGASVEDSKRKHQFDLYYIKNNSLLLDLAVLIETVSVVLFREGQ
jgi:sugar transferase (PEP-CTERM system associated)